MGIFSLATAPFWTATLVLIGLIVAAGMGLGGDHDAHGHEDMGGPIGWLNLGRVPLSVLLVILSGVFAATGFAVTAFAHAQGWSITPLGGVLVAAMAALASARRLSLIVSRILPRSETYVLDQADLVGRDGVVTVGPLERGSTGRIKVSDAHGNMHFPRAIPADPAVKIPSGTPVKVIGRVGQELVVEAALAVGAVLAGPDT
jgi:membrane protein implicated in regulation of membrane protease activity